MRDISRLQPKTANKGATAEGILSHENWNELVLAAQELQQHVEQGETDLATKAGVVKVVTGPDGTSNVTALFRNEDDYDDWNALADEDKWTSSLLLSYDTLPSFTETDVYSVGLILQSEPSQVQADANVTINVRGTSVVKRAVGGTEDVSEPLTVTVQHRTSSTGAWVTRTTVEIQSNDAAYTAIDLSPFLASGTNYVRVRAAGAEANSIWRTLSLNVVNLSLTPGTAFQIPMTGTGSLTLDYFYTGAIAKTLQFEFGTGSGTSFVAQYSYVNNDPGCSRSLGSGAATETAASFIFDDSAMMADLLTDGVHTVRARLYVSDSVRTDWVESQYMVDNALGSPVVIVNNVVSELDNWTDVVFFDWAADTAGRGTMNVVFRLVDSADSTKEYARWTQVASDRTLYSLSTQLGIEIADTSVTDIYAYMHIEDEEGNALADPVFFAIGNDASNNPTAGADFILSPASRSNAEANPKTIINAATGQEVTSTWTGFGMKTDGWMEVPKDVDDASQGTVRALHIPAGRKLTIGYDPLVNFRSGDSTGRSMTLEMDVRTDNILDDTEPILDICTEHAVDGDAFGIRLLPKEIYVMTQNKRTRDDQNATWAEGKRLHIAVNVLYGVSGLNWVRVFLDARCERMFLYQVSDIFSGGPVSIAIGNSSSDIDIFGMRCYQKALSTSDVMQDRKAAYSTVAEKIAFASRNDILGDNGSIDFNKAKEKFNVLGLTGHLAKYGDSDKGKTKNTTLYQSKVDEPSMAGTYTALENSGQGTTAMTYYDWNQQQKVSDNTTFISDADGSETAVSDIYVAQGEARAKKACGKINFASSPQGHKMGLTRIYTELFRQLVSTGAMSQPGQFATFPNARLTVYEDPYLFFHRETANDPWVFKYQMTWGAGKGDKPTFGFNKSSTPHMLMVEGADNNRELANFKIPWNDDVTYSPDDEAWIYNGQKHINFGFGKTSEDETGEFPSDTEAINAVKAFFNFCYLHHRSVTYFDGTLTQLRNSSAADHSKAYWTTQADSALGTARYDLFRWSPIDNTWVAAGVSKLGTASYETLNIRTQYEAFGGTATWTAGQWAVINSQFVAQRTSHFKANASTYMHTDDALYHDCFVFFVAGTDNRAKNTYYYTDPVTLKIRWMQDDLDTVLKTNNVGQNRKPYYVELHDKNSAGNYYWQGEDNGLYNLLEAAYPTERETMMRNMLSGMASLGGSAFGYLTSRILEAQQYYPEIVYNEVARLVYMQAQVAKEAGTYTHNTDPVTQACGSQYWSEYDWLKDRLMYISSWCEYGEFAASTDTPGAFMFRGAAGSYSFVLTPAKWLYPRVGSGSSNVAPSASGKVRVEAGQAFSYATFTETSDSTITIRGINYYLDIGDMNVPMDTGQGLTVPGKMLQRFRFNPDGDDEVLSAANAVTVTAKNIRELTIRGLITATGQLDISQCTRLETVDVRDSGFSVVTLPPSEALATVHFPATLTRLTIDSQPGLANVDFEGVDYLGTIYVDAAQAGSLNTALLAQSIWQSKTASGTEVTSATFLNVDWTSIRADMLMWYASSDAVTITGSIAMLAATNDRYLVFTEVQTLIDKFGNVQSTDNDLYIDYPKGAISAFNVKGVKYIESTGEFTGWSLNILPSTGNNVLIDPVTGKESVLWYFDSADAEAASQYAEFTDPVRGILNVKALSDPALALSFTVHVKMDLVNGTSITVDKQVGFYRRVPRVGDFAYLDGTFDNEYDQSKDLAGVVVKRDEIRDSGDVLTGYNLTVMCKENASVVATDGTVMTTSPRWGLYPDPAGTNGFPSDLLAEVAEAANLSSASDTAIQNRTRSGIVDGSNTNYLYLDDHYLDPTQDDGYAEIYLGTDGLSSAADFNSEQNTATIKAHADAIILGYLNKAIPTTLAELGDLMQELRAAHDGSTIYDEFVYPAAYACALYDPEVSKGERDAQYAKGRWALPAAGILARIYNFYHNSRGRVSGGTISVNYADETIATEANIPLFANTMKRIADKAAGGVSPFTYPGNANHWSSTEYSGYYAWLFFFSSGNFGNGNKGNGFTVRPVAAFTFTV